MSVCPRQEGHGLRFHTCRWQPGCGPLRRLVFSLRRGWVGLVTPKPRDGKDFKKYVGLIIHDFRRSAIRNMTRRGVNDRTAMRISGHRMRQIFMRYNIVEEADLVDASKKITAGPQGSIPAAETDTKLTC